MRQRWDERDLMNRHGSLWNIVNIRDTDAINKRRCHDFNNDFSDIVKIITRLRIQTLISRYYIVKRNFPRSE